MKPTNKQAKERHDEGDHFHCMDLDPWWNEDCEAYAQELLEREDEG